MNWPRDLQWGLSNTYGDLWGHLCWRAPGYLGSDHQVLHDAVDRSQWVCWWKKEGGILGSNQETTKDRIDFDQKKRKREDASNPMSIYWIFHQFDSIKGKDDCLRPRRLCSFGGIQLCIHVLLPWIAYGFSQSCSAVSIRLHSA